MDGLYAAASFYVPDFEAEKEKNSAAGQWSSRYEQKFGERPAPQSIIGYVIGDLIVRALQDAGPDLTLERFLAALEGIEEYQDMFGGPTLSLSPTKHQAANYLNLYQVADGNWVTVEQNISF
jgi:branched-chain amino acid transport system substrate-binding protein